MTEDEFQAYLTHEAAKAIGEWLAASAGSASRMERRRVWDLTLTDLEHMAIAAISRYALLRAERIAEEANSLPPLPAIALHP